MKEIIQTSTYFDMRFKFQLFVNTTAQQLLSENSALPDKHPTLEAKFPYLPLITAETLGFPRMKLSKFLGF